MTLETATEPKIISKELGIIFIVNFPFDKFNETNDTGRVQDQVMDFYKGYFKFSDYKVNHSADIYLISCFSGIEPNKRSPNTWVTKLEIKKGESGKEYYEKNDVLNFGAVNLGNKDVLSGILVSVKAKINAKKYILLFYNHSSAFGLFNTTPDDLSGVTARSSTTNVDHFLNNEKFLLPRFGSNFSLIEPNKFHLKTKKVNSAKKSHVRREEISPDYKPDMLTNSELLIALDRAFNLERSRETDPPAIEIIFGGGCYFLNIELAYTLRKSANYLVGAEGVMPPPTYNYPVIINNLFDELEIKKSADKIDYEKVISNVLDSIEDIYQFKDDKQATDENSKAYIKAYNDVIQSWINSTYVSAINCAELDNLVSLFNQAILFCFAQPKRSVMNIVRAIFNQFDLSKKFNSIDGPFHLYDLKDFIVRLNAKEDDPELKELFEKIINVFDSRLTVGKAFVHSEATNKDLIRSIFGGLSFYFPVDRLAAAESFNFMTFYGSGSRNESFFSKETLWNNFIHFFHKYLKLYGASLNSTFVKELYE